MFFYPLFLDKSTAIFHIDRCTFSVRVCVLLFGVLGCNFALFVKYACASLFLNPFTKLLNLFTAARGVLEVHKVDDYQKGRILSFSNDLFGAFRLSKNRLHRTDLESRSKFYDNPPKPRFNYPLIQRDIQLKSCEALNDTMNSKNHKENNLKYTSVNLKQKRREMREGKASSNGRGRFSSGTQKRYGHANRINSKKNEPQTQFCDYDNPLASSMRKTKTNISSCENPSAQKEHISRRNYSNHFQPSVVFHRNEPHVRFSVRGTRIFGRRKSYRACLTPKGDAALSNGASLINCRSSSLPCELSQVESHDYEYWNSGFVQSRVRKLEEELASKCEDKFSYAPDYDVQSLYSLQLDKILPDRDDYRIAYLSSTSQESSLDYMEDNYCTVGMGTLDVRLNKKYLIPGNEDWDLTFSSEENDDSSSDDDEFFYRKCPNAGTTSSILSPSPVSRNSRSSKQWDGNIPRTSKHGKKCSNAIGAGNSDDPDVIARQIRENVDRIFYNAMHCEFDVPLPVQEKQNISRRRNNEAKVNCFTDGEKMVPNTSVDVNSDHVLVEPYSNCVFRDKEPYSGEAEPFFEHLETKYSNISERCEFFNNNLADDFLEFNSRAVVNKNDAFVRNQFYGMKPQPFCATVANNAVPNYALPENDSSLKNLQSKNVTESVSKYPLSDCGEISKDLLKSEDAKTIRDFENRIFSDKGNDTNKININEDDFTCTKFKTNNIFITANITSCETRNTNKLDNLEGKKIASKRKYKRKREKWSEIGKLSKSVTEPFWEAKLLLYEPLCTPFAEIYFITYGEKYPTTYCFKVSIPRNILTLTEPEMILKFLWSNIMPLQDLHTLKAGTCALVVCKQLKEIYSIIKNDDILNETGSYTIKFHNFLPDYRLLRSVSFLRFKNFEALLESENKIARLDSKEGFVWNRSESEELSENCVKSNDSQLRSDEINDNTSNEASFYSNIKCPKLGKCINLEKCLEVAETEDISIRKPENALILTKIFDELRVSKNLTDVTPLRNLLFSNKNLSGFNIFISSNGKSSKGMKHLNESYNSIDVNIMISHKFTKLSEINLKSFDSEAVFIPKALAHFDFCTRKRSNSRGRTKTFPNKKIRRIETNNKISKDIYRSKHKKQGIRNKKWDLLFHTLNLDRNITFRKNSSGRKRMRANHLKTSTEHRRAAGNRNYGISKRETEISSEVQRFGVDSFLDPTTSSTGNATFAEYFFAPQLASLRDSKKEHLPFSWILRSVPAVQRRLPDRESRSVQSGKDRKHGYLYADSVTDSSDCMCASQDSAASDENPFSISNSCESERIINHDFGDYACPGSVPKGLQQPMCGQLTAFETKCNPLNPETSQQIMATSKENPRLINKFTRTPGRNISKLRKLFDSGESSVSDSDSKIHESNSLSSQHANVNNTSSVSKNARSEVFDPVINTHNQNDQPKNLNCNDITSLHKNGSKSTQRIPDIPYCRKVSNGGDLWKNVDICVKSSSDGLWSDSQNSDVLHSHATQSGNSFVSSTADLHNLIAASRAELSKKKETSLSDKSTLENYFTSFENSMPKKFASSNSSGQISCTENFKASVMYDCDADEMTFDDEEAMLSDTSSEEEIRCDTNMNNTHYLPAYALHTIIEESCEESEKDSRGSTPTNKQVTSKLERYFSWDIINDTDINVKSKENDDSTVYSDSLSEGSGSLNGDANKEVDPVQLASSRLEKYFTSGLVGNENYFYPDDAEFLEDGPVSDFEEDIHQKISRSALLSSLETVVEKHAATSNELLSNDISLCKNTDELVCDTVLSSYSVSENLESIVKISDLSNIYAESDILQVSKSEIKHECDVIIEEDETSRHEDNTPNTFKDSVLSSNMDNSKDIDQDCEVKKSESTLTENASSADDVLSQKQTVSKEQLAVDVRGIIKKLLRYFSKSGSNSFKHNTETDYMSAWQILETEIERLIQSISPENNSCSNSTIDSNNSDYGSDTIESLDCMTDEDESAESKSRSHTKYPLVDLFATPYKSQTGTDFHNFNISDETLSIWKRLIQSLQKDSFFMNDKSCDPNTEARLYIRDQIVNLMHTVTVSESKDSELNSEVFSIQDKEITSSLAEENVPSESINEAFNLSVGLSEIPEERSLTSKIESVNELPKKLKTCETSSDRLEEESKLSDTDIQCASNQKMSLSEKSQNSNVEESMTLHTHKISVDDKISVDEVDAKLNTKRTKSSECNSSFSVCVDIDLNEELSSVILEKSVKMKASEIDDSSPHLCKTMPKSLAFDKSDSLYVDDDDNDNISELPGSNEIFSCANSNDARILEKSHRDTGYYSFKSSNDSILHETPPPDEFLDVPNFKSLKRSMKKFSLSDTLSKSTTNINQLLSGSDTKFSTLQLKNHKSKKSSNSNSSPSRQFTSLFSPAAVFKKLTGSKSEYFLEIFLLNFSCIDFFFLV